MKPHAHHTPRMPSRKKPSVTLIANPTTGCLQPAAIALPITRAGIDNP
ncbi:hypothetical protein [Kribbella sancticallisti]